MRIISIPTWVLSPRTSEVVLVPDSNGDGIHHLVSVETFVENRHLDGKIYQKVQYVHHGRSYSYEVQGQRELDLLDAIKRMPGDDARVGSVQWISPGYIEKLLDLEKGWDARG